MKAILKYSFLALALSLSIAPRAHAAPKPTPVAVPPKAAPEIDPALAVTGLALLAGSLSIVRARRSKG